MSDKNRDDPLENHVATVAKYIEVAREMKQMEYDTRIALMIRFNKYLIACCWQKLIRRIRHWSWGGFVYCLGKVNKVDLQAAVAPATSPLRNDVGLATKLADMAKRKQVETLMDKCPRDEMRSKLPSLLDACDRMLNMRRLEKSQKAVSGLYNKDTCFEFHQLLVATLLSYGKALDAFEEARGNAMQVQVDRAKDVWQYAFLLWSIAYSQILQDHLKVLVSKGWLARPENLRDNLMKYNQFTTLKCGKDRTISFASSGNSQDEDDAGNNDEGNTAGEAENDETKTILEDANMVEVFKAWIRLQVDRLQAVRKITSLCSRSSMTINLNLLAVKYDPPRPADDVMVPWRTTIMDVCANEDQLDPTFVIETLEQLIDSELKNNPRCAYIFHKFNPDPLNPIIYKGNKHCEMILACLLKYPELWAGDKDLVDCLKVWPHFQYRSVCQPDMLHRMQT